MTEKTSSNQVKERLQDEYRRLTDNWAFSPVDALRYLAQGRAAKLIGISETVALAELQDIAAEHDVSDAWRSNPADTESNDVFIKQQFVDFFDKYNLLGIQSVILDEDGTIHVRYTNNMDMVSQEFEADSEFRKDLENLFWDRE